MVLVITSIGGHQRKGPFQQSETNYYPINVSSVNVADRKVFHCLLFFAFPRNLRITNVNMTEVCCWNHENFIGSVIDNTAGLCSGMKGDYGL